MCYCKHKKYARSKKEMIAWEKGCSEYLKSENAWKYSFDSEYSMVDCEQSVLSQLIFIRLFGKIIKFTNIEMVEGGRAISIEDKNIKKDFLFDIMHNPKSCQPHEQAQLYAYGKLGFEKIYHTIGNMAPVPKTIVSKNYGPNLQHIHKDLNELWPWFLKFLQDNWKEFPTEVDTLMSFREYMTYTCQQIYFTRIFDKVYKLYNEGRNWEELIYELEREKIEKNDTLISFNNLFKDEESISEMDRRIKFLIELRGKYIIHLLNDDKKIDFKN